MRVRLQAIEQMVDKGKKKGVSYEPSDRIIESFFGRICFLFYNFCLEIRPS